MYFELLISFCAIFLVFFAVDMFLVIRPAIMEMTGKKKEKLDHNKRRNLITISVILVVAVAVGMWVCSKLKR